MRLHRSIILGLCLASSSAFSLDRVNGRTMSTQEKEAVCSFIWSPENGFMQVRLVAHRILELHPFTVLEAQNRIRRFFPDHREVSDTDIYDGLHRILWEDLIKHHLTALPSPRLQKNFIKHAIRRVTEVYGR